MEQGTILDFCTLEKSAAAATSAGTAVDGTEIDMAGYDGVVFFVAIATANAGNFLKASGGNTSGSLSDIAGSKAIVDSDADIAILDIYRPIYRYLRPHVVRAGANTATGEVYAIRYKGRIAPRVNDVTNTQNLVSLISPSQGTP